eukprot:179967_1
MASSSPPPHVTSPPPDTPLGEEEDLMENMATDYKAQPELDIYDADDIDDGDISPMGISARRGVEDLLNERDRRQGRLRRGFIPRQLREEDEEIPMALAQQGMMIDDDVYEQEQHESLVNLEDFDGPLREWLDEDRVRREIKMRFKNFLTSYTDTSGNAVYPPKVRQMCQDNGCSLSISYMHLSEFAAVLAIWLVEQPAIMLELFDEVGMEVAKLSFPEYGTIHSSIHVRITNLPLTDELRDLRQ